VRDRVRPRLRVVLGTDAIHSVPLVGVSVPLPKEHVAQVRPAVGAGNLTVRFAASHGHVATVAGIVAFLESHHREEKRASASMRIDFSSILHNFKQASQRRIEVSSRIQRNMPISYLPDSRPNLGP